jgi:hypothetical protein
MFLSDSCKKDSPTAPVITQEEKLEQHEKKIISKIDDFMPTQIASMFQDHFNSIRNEQDYAFYLDSLETSIDDLKSTIQLNSSIDEYEKAMNNTLLDLQQKNSIGCSGLGYAKGCQIDVSISGKVGLDIVAGLQAAGGGGVKTVYDFVNLDRQVYYYKFCSQGFTFGVGTAAILSAGLGFTGVNEVITGIKYLGNNSGLNKFEGHGMAQSYSLSSDLAAFFGIGLSVGIGTSSSAEADFNGIRTTQPCPQDIVVIENGTKGYSLDVTGSLSALSIGAEFVIAFSSNTVGSYTYGAANTYTKFSPDRVLAGSKMAKELLIRGPMSGITSNKSPFDLVASTVALIYGCKNVSSCPSQIPAIGTKPIINLTSTSAKSGGIIKSDGGSNIALRGTVWNTSENPTINNKTGMTIDGQGIGEFTSDITNLTAHTTYYVRAYATNSAGTSYGRQVSFKTGQNIVVPTLSTTDITSITTSTASGGGTIADDGGASVTVRGVCWSTSPNPTTANDKTSNGIGIGAFTSSITGLNANTTYNVRAYAINSAGTAYGTQVSFKTLLPELSTYEAKNFNSVPTIDGQINDSEWSNGNVYNISLTRKDGFDTKPGTLYLQHDGTWLYVGVKTNVDDGWDVYLQLRFDGNNDNILNGRSTEPHTDIDIECPSPGGWPGYVRYDYLVTTNGYPITPPVGTIQKSYSSTNVNYEYKIKLSDLNTSSGQIIGFYIYNLVDAYPDHGYEFPIRLTATDPSKWEHLLLK